MTGRGRPRKAENPETKHAKSKTTPEEIKQDLPRSQRKDFTEEKHNGTTKEEKPKKREQRKPNHTDEKPSVQSTRKEQTTKHFTEEINKQKRTPTDNTKAPVRGTKAKTCAGRTKSTDQSAEETTRTQPETPTDTTKTSVKTTKARKSPGRTKSPQEFENETMMTQIPKDKAKTCANKAISPEKFTEETIKMKPESPKYTKEACVPQHRCEDKARVDPLLLTTLEKLKIKKNDRADAAVVINAIRKNIIEHVKQNIDWFKDVEPLPTGSYYENLKISNPDEFDVMLAIPVDRVNINPFGDDGAYYSVGLKRGNRHLEKFQEANALSASKMLEEFREEVKKCVKAFPEWEVTKKKKGCPAVTLTTEVKSIFISLDVVLCLKVKSSWPPFTKDGFKIEGWLGTKIKRDQKLKPYYLVPKYEGKGTVEYNGVLAKDVWRISFSHVEKYIMQNHGSEKTCCEREGERCCRKDCLKLLKHLLSLLKERDPSFEKFCSYYAKTTFLHACCTRTKDSDWKASRLSQCFQQLLDDFVGHLEKGALPNFFIPDQNLLSGSSRTQCDSLARCIKRERDSGFPIFK